MLRSRPVFRVSGGSGEAAAPSAPMFMFVCECASLIMWRSEATVLPQGAATGKSSMMGGKLR